MPERLNEKLSKHAENFNDLLSLPHFDVAL